MKKEEIKPENQQPYVEQKVIATYEKDELEETIKAQGVPPFWWSYLQDNQSCWE